MGGNHNIGRRTNKLGNGDFAVLGRILEFTCIGRIWKVIVNCRNGYRGFECHKRHGYHVIAVHSHHSIDQIEFIQQNSAAIIQICIYSNVVRCDLLACQQADTVVSCANRHHPLIFAIAAIIGAIAYYGISIKLPFTPSMSKRIHISIHIFILTHGTRMRRVSIINTIRQSHNINISMLLHRFNMLLTCSAEAPSPIFSLFGTCAFFNYFNLRKIVLVILHVLRKFNNRTSIVGIHDTHHILNRLIAFVQSGYLLKFNNVSIGKHNKSF